MLSRTNLILALLAAAALSGSALVTGRIEIGGGQGWDGADYASMIADGWFEGTASTALRPFVVALNLPAYLAFGSAVAAFHAMNHVYVALLTLALAALLGRYGATRWVKVLFIVNLLLAIALVKYAAYYPVMIDVGALAVIVLGLLAVVADADRRLVAAACVAAVLSREFGLALVAFGVCRDLRRRAPLWRTAATFGPALAAAVVLRAVVAAHWPPGSSGELLRAADLLGNLHEWRDPVFVGFFVYFLATIIGGASLSVWAQPGRAFSLLRREPEWGAYGLMVLAAAAVGDADIWRYLLYLLPVLAVLFVVAAPEDDGPASVAWAALVCLATVVTQRPWQAMDLTAYFRDWFPYYAHKGNVPDAYVSAIWPAWGWYLLTAAALLSLLALFSGGPRRPSLHAERS